MILFHLAHVYNKTSENFNANTKTDEENDDEETNTYYDLYETLTNTQTGRIIVLLILFISVAAAIYSFILNSNENQPWSIRICCALNAAYFNIFYFIFIVLVKLNTTSSFRYVEFSKDFIDQILKKTEDNLLPKIIKINKLNDIKLNYKT
jgi:hypothetical protein